MLAPTTLDRGGSRATISRGEVSTGVDKERLLGTGDSLRRLGVLDQAGGEGSRPSGIGGRLGKGFQGEIRSGGRWRMY